MAGDGGDKYQYRALAKRDGVDNRTPFEKQAAARFDSECKGLPRNKLDQKVKEHARHLMRKHLKEVEGKKEIAFIEGKDISHFVSDVISRTKGKLNFSDIRNIDKFWQKSTRVIKNQPHKEGEKGVVYDKYEFTLRGNKLYIVVKKVRTKGGITKRIHSINDEI